MFVGSVRDNLRLARPAETDAELWTALRRWTRMPGWPGSSTGSTPRSGRVGVSLTPAQAQQVALARLVLADPHTLVLDEATSLMDPRAARHLERSLAGVLEGRTVVAIAHRLHTAHDADVIAVVEDGRIVEWAATTNWSMPKARTPRSGTPGTGALTCCRGRLMAVLTTLLALPTVVAFDVDARAPAGRVRR